MGVFGSITAWIEDRRVEVGMLLVGLILIGGGVMLINSGKQSESVQVLAAETEASPEANLMIDVSGAVISPGVYEVTQNTRLGEVLSAAGGLSAEADVIWVEANVNKAEKVIDGQKIYIPKIKEDPTSPSADTQSTLGVAHKVILNSASVSELDTLPGIGPVTAIKIISGRPYRSIQELLDRKIVGSKVFEQIKGLVSLW